MPAISATGSAGFTLFEMLVVLAIVALAIGAWPLATSRLFPAQQLRTEAQDFVAYARHARTTARTSGQNQSISLSENQYGIGGDIHSLPRGMSLRVANSGASHEGQITFFPDGSAKETHLEFALAGKSTQVSIGSLSGRVALDP